MAKTVRLIDIGKKLGVSAVTVSKALSGQKGVSEEMREKIVRLADEMGVPARSRAAKKKVSRSALLLPTVIWEKISPFTGNFIRRSPNGQSPETVSRCWK